MLGVCDDTQTWNTFVFNSMTHNRSNRDDSVDSHTLPKGVVAPFFPDRQGGPESFGGRLIWVCEKKSRSVA